MFAELAAAQMGAATAPDSRIFKALGVHASESTAIPVGRVFPVGARSGADGALLGDGSTATVYRALGRGLAALIMDDRALNDYVAYTLGNRGGLEPKKHLGTAGVPIKMISSGVRMGMPNLRWGVIVMANMLPNGWRELQRIKFYMGTSIPPSMLPVTSNLMKN